jgi:hypothetical protein
MFNQWQIWFFIDARSRNVIHDWLIAEKVPKEQIAAFQAKIDDLERGGPDLVPGFITATPIAAGIYKMKVKGNRGWKQLRPMCCRGPFAPHEYTILHGAVERDNKLPKDVKKRARANLDILLKDPGRRRRERLTGITQTGIQRS